MTAAGRRWAVILSLSVAGMGALIGIGAGIVQALIATGRYVPADPNLNIKFVYGGVAGVVIGVATFALIAPTEAQKLLGRRRFRRGSDTAIVSAAFAGILIAVNILAVQYPVSWDVTEGGQHTLAPETKLALKNISSEVTAIAFFTSATPSDGARQLLEDFRTAGGGRFNFRFVDPNSDPVLAKSYKVQSDGTVILAMGTQTQMLSTVDETGLTEALIRLLNPESRAIYFLTGHGEADIQATDSAGFSRARQALEALSYKVGTASLAGSGTIPSDAKLVVIAGATQPLLAQESANLQTYLKGGGAMLALLEPTPLTKIVAANDPISDWLISDWGIQVNDDLVIDTTSNNPLQAVSASYSSTSPITRGLTSYAIMPAARSLQLGSAAPAGVTTENLITTASQAWGETNFQSVSGQGGQQLSFDTNSDMAGPLMLAASAENSQTHGRVVVFGSAAFAANGAFDAYANGTIFTNAVAWAAGQSGLLNLTPNSAIARTFRAPGNLELIAIGFGSQFGLPLIILIAGIASWWNRRRRA